LQIFYQKSPQALVILGSSVSSNSRRRRSTESKRCSNPRTKWSPRTSEIQISPTRNGDFRGFHGDLTGFHCDFRGFHGDLMGFHCDLMGFHCDLMGFPW
jgi:hypothetical protein